MQTNKHSKEYKTLLTKIENGIASVTLNNRPVNALSGTMMLELNHFLNELSKNQTVKVIVFDSANPDFFLAHVDMKILDNLEILDELIRKTPQGLNIFQTVGELIRNQPQVTIVKLKGIARGGGAEFVAAADMSFASLEKGKLSQNEALMGIIPGGGATQYLKGKMTRGRMLEVILGADLLDASVAENYGWINRAIPDSEIDEFVDHLAKNIAALPEGVVQKTKDVIKPEIYSDGFQAENDGWAALAYQPEFPKLIKTALEKGAQTVEGELKLEELLRGLFEEKLISNL